jgi:hypothetical protein
MAVSRVHINPATAATLDTLAPATRLP